MVIKPGKYHIAHGAQILDTSGAVFRVCTPESDGTQTAECLHGDWTMTMWEDGGNVKAKIDGWPGSEFENLRFQQAYHDQPL